MTFYSKIKHLIYFILSSLVIGLLVGALSALFGQTLIALSSFRDSHLFYLLPFLAPMGMLFIFLFHRYGGEATKGMTLIFQTGHGKKEHVPLRLIPFIIGGTWLTHLFGGSAGREGVAVQLGAAVANFFSRHFQHNDYKKLFIVTGMAAGFAGLYQTPIAAICFGIEVLIIGRLYHQALLTAGIAAFTASWTSHSLGLEKFSVPLQATWAWTVPNGVALVLAAIAFGLTGLLFSSLLKQTKQLAARYLPHPVVRIGLLGLGASLLIALLFYGRYAGLGTNLIELSFNGGDLYRYDWLLKLLLTILTLAAGFQGGEVTPLFAIGAALGITIGHLFGLPIELMAALGYASVFGSATNTWLAPIFIGGEVFGYSYMPLFFIVCTISYLCNFNRSIYGEQYLPQPRTSANTPFFSE